MEEVNSILLSTLDKYFLSLTITGNIPLPSVNAIIVLSAINYLINNYTGYITEEDATSIMNALYCIGGNCLIDLPITLTKDSLLHDINLKVKYRKTQSGELRLTELSRIRIIN